MREKDFSWDLKDKCMEPLAQIYDRGEHLIVSMDLPCVKKEDIEVLLTENTLEVKAKMGRTYKFCRWGTVQRCIEFESFHKMIELPHTVDPEKASSEFRQGILEINLPKKQVKKRLEIK
ncbi:MAG: Hsp20/alpha crystallin family protein [Candidatus Altiarchaeota archaeon]|nr:Hsp20/alpha crystallin family protein [Candidatus Altiarchaeota archaeon]